MQVSHSKIELYNTCGYKFKLKYIDKWDPNKTYTPLLFGGAVDKALNYILKQVKNSKAINLDYAKKVFKDQMNTWQGQNELVFFKNELPVEYNESDDLQIVAFNNLIQVGNKILETYITDILPQFKTVDDIQIKRHIKNEEDDTLIIILDFTATLLDGRKVVFDNKTSSDIKKYYKDDSVKKSNQLALYTDYYPDHYSGYIALSKKIKNDKIEWKMIVDKIPEEKTSEVFNDIETKTQMIKEGIFEKNEKACFSFGKKCEFYNLCKYGNSEGLIKK